MPVGIPQRLQQIDLALVGAWDYVYAAAFAVEDDLAVDEREQCVISALADALAGVELGAQLADQDIAGDDLLAAESLDATTLAVRIATVATGALTFFMCHGSCLLNLNRKRILRAHGENRNRLRPL
jgi:hypothetical protein